MDGAIQISQVNTTVGARAVAFTKVTDVLLLLFLKIAVGSQKLWWLMIDDTIGWCDRWTVRGRSRRINANCTVLYAKSELQRSRLYCVQYSI